MTDNEIIKALECCSTDIRENTCPVCAFYKKHRCSTLMLNAASDLINRQKAEIERLEKEITEYKLRMEMLSNTVNEIKSEAIKEFAEQLKKRFYLLGGSCVVNTLQIDNLVKGMTEVK